QVALAVRLPGERRAVLAVEVGVQLPAGPQVRAPGVPRLVLLGQRPRPVATHQQPEAVGRLTRVVPPLRLDGHAPPPRLGRRPPPASRPRTSSTHAAAGSPYGRNFSSRPCSSLWNSARCSPSLPASGVSIRLLESATLIWNATRISNSRSACRSRLRVRLFTVS